jgi:pilus assembly protein CpaB
MRGKSLALLVLALGCGLVASLGITQVLARRGEQAAPVDTVPIYVAKADIAQGSLTGDDSVKLEQWPKDHVPTGALSRKEDIEGRRARYKIFPNQPILDPMLMHAGEVSLDAQIPKGLRVVAIPVGIETIQSGLVAPGSRCDVQVFLRADASLGIGETLSKTILQDIRVFAVNDITTTQAADPRDPEKRSFAGGKTVSLLVTPDQAEMVTLASQLGTVRLILRSAEDSEHTKDRPISAHELLGGMGVGDQTKEGRGGGDKGIDKWFEIMKKALAANASTNKSAPAKPRKPEEFTMRLLAGTDRADVLMVANADVIGMPGDDGAWTVANLPAPNPASVKPAGPQTPAANPPAKPQGDNSTNLKVNGKPPLGG